MKKPWQKWVIPLGLAVGLAWLTSRPSADGGFIRIPTGHGPAPDWSSQDILGGTIASSNLLGHVLVLNFWATWCPPCQQEIPELNAFAAAHETDGIRVVGVAMDEAGESAVRPFAKKNAIGYPIILNTAEIQRRFFGVPAPAGGPPGISLPTTFIVGTNGHFLARYIGAITRAELEKAVASTVSSQPR